MKFEFQGGENRMKRTSDVAFFKCPICGRNPYVKTFNLNYGVAYCKGTLFKRHPLIRIETEYCNPSKLYKTLSDGWNYSQRMRLNDLPIKMNVKQTDQIPISKEGE